MAATLVPDHSEDPETEPRKRLAAEVTEAVPAADVVVAVGMVITVVETAMAEDATMEMETETPVDVAMEITAVTVVEIINSHEAIPASAPTPTEEMVAEAVETAARVRVEMAVRAVTAEEVVLAMFLRPVLMCVRDFQRACSPPAWRAVQEDAQDQESKNIKTTSIKKYSVSCLIFTLFACISFHYETQFMFFPPQIFIYLSFNCINI